MISASYRVDFLKLELIKESLFMIKKDEDAGSALMKMVEAVAISAENARIIVSQYREQVIKSQPKASEKSIQKVITDKIISRYSMLAATSGAVTSAPGAFPGIGTAVSMIGGGLADVSVCMKLQIDMTMCLAMAINENLSNEDAKHMSFIIALAGSLEQLGSKEAVRIGSKAGLKMVNKYLTGGTLLAIKALFSKVGIIFTQKAAQKAIPFGIGVVIGAGANYALSQYVGKAARDLFLLDVEEKSGVG
jgi:hypothetical protein